MKSNLTLLFSLLTLSVLGQALPTNYPVVPFSQVQLQSVASNQDAIVLYHWTGSNYLSRRMPLSGLSNLFSGYNGANITNIQFAINAGTSTNQPLVEVTRGTNKIYFSSITNYYAAGFKSGDSVLLGNGTNFDFGIGPMQLQPGMKFQGLGTNLSFLFFDTNCFMPTNNVTFAYFSILSTNYPSSSPDGTPSVIKSLAGGTCANFKLDHMNVVCPGGEAFNFAAGGSGNLGFDVEHSFIESGLSFFYSSPSVTTGTTYWADDNIYMLYQTNLNTSIWSAFECNGTGLSNTVINVSVTHDFNYTTNNPETIAYFGSGATAFINNLTARMVNTNNLANWKNEEVILLEQASGSGIQVGPQQPSSTFVAYNLSPPATNLYPVAPAYGDWTKLGMNELSFITNAPISVASNGSFVIPSFNTTVDWCSTVSTSPNFQDFLNYIKPYPYSASWNFSAIAPGGVNGMLVLTNTQYGYSVGITAPGGMYVTNLGTGPNVLVLSNNADQFNITNLGIAPNSLETWAESFSGGTLNGNNPKQGKYVNVVYGNVTTNTFSLSGPFAPAAVFNTYSGYNFFSLRAPNTTQLALTNIWVAYAPPGARGVSFSIGLTGTNSPDLNCAFETDGTNYFWSTNFFGNFTGPLSGPSVSTAKITSTNGIATLATGSFGPITASGWTNNTAVDYLLYINSYSGFATNYDAAGNAMPFINPTGGGTVSLIIQPGGKFLWSGANTFYVHPL